MKDIFLAGRRPYLWIILIGFIVYAYTLTFGFSGLDDWALIIGNAEIMRDPANIARIFQQGPYLKAAPDAQYRPLVILSFMLDALIGGTRPFIYHFTNLLLHLFSAGLVFIFMQKLEVRRSLAFIFTVLFTVHPALTQAVAWIPGRNDSLLAIFLLLSFLFFIKYLESGYWAYYPAHLLFFIFGLLTKETAVSMALLCPLYVWLLRDKKGLIYSAGPLITALLWLMLRQLTFAQSAGYDFAYFFASIAGNLPAVLGYAGKILFPVNLSPLPILRDSPLIYGILSVLLLLISLLFSKEKRSGRVIFGICWFLFFILPTLVKIKEYPVLLLLENRNYLPIIGCMLALLEIDFIKKIKYTRRSIAVIACIITAFSLTAVTHSFIFSDSYLLLERDVSGSPHFSAMRFKLAQAHFKREKFAAAEKELLTYLEQNPKDVMAHHNLAMVYAAQNQLDRAEKEYKNTLKIEERSETYVRLSELYCRTGKYSQAEKMLLRGMRINPFLIKGHYYLAGIYFAQKNYPQAIKAYQEEISSNPTNEAALVDLGILYARQGQGPKAVNLWEMALAVNPQSASACQELARHYMRTKDYNKAAYYLDEVRKNGGRVSSVLSP